MWMPHGVTDIACVKKIDFAQEPDTESGTRLWSMTFNAVTKDKSVLCLDGARAYIGMFITDGTIRIIGGKGSAPLISVVPYAGAYSVSAEFKDIDPVVI